MSLNVPEWLPGILPWLGTAAAVGYAIRVSWKSKQDTETCKTMVNFCVEKECPKVAHNFDIEDLGTKVSFCRCWKSAKFPYCDGTHGSHNKETGDNVGPLNLKRKGL